jgi:hypothetical protein
MPPPLPDALLARARALAATADDEAAKLAYIDVLREHPTHLAALNELGNLALAAVFAQPRAPPTSRRSGITRPVRWCG